MTVAVVRDSIKAQRLIELSDKSLYDKDPRTESIYRLIPVEVIKPPKEKTYRSKFADQARIEYKRGMKPAASMGPAKVYVNKPNDFLKKHEKEARLPTPHEYHYNDANRRPSVPKRTEVADLPKPSNKDFKKTNALQIINSVPKNKYPEKPKYVNKKDYGQVPGYLRNRELENEQQRENEKKLEQARREEEQKLFYNIQEAEKKQILDGLKAKWEKLNSDYQKLSLTVDTVPKINRKVSMENQLKILEQDIAKFSQNNLYIKMSS